MSNLNCSMQYLHVDVTTEMVADEIDQCPVPNRTRLEHRSLHLSSLISIMIWHHTGTSTRNFSYMYKTDHPVINIVRSLATDRRSLERMIVSECNQSATISLGPLETRWLRVEKRKSRSINHGLRACIRRYSTKSDR